MYKPLLSLTIQLFTLILLARVIFSWMPDLPEPLIKFRDFSHQVTDWAVEPLQKRIPPLRVGNVYLDLSVLVLFFILQIIASLLARL